MLSNRKFINELKQENIELEKKVEYLEKDNENLQNSVCNLLDANKELSLSNNYLENKIKLLEKVIKQHEENECALNTKLCKYKGMLDNIDSYKRMLEGRGIE